jgi:Tol biopolymer transport system component
VSLCMSARPSCAVRTLVACALITVVGSCADPPPTGIGNGSNDASPSWSPAGDSIAFVHFQGNLSDPYQNGVYVIGINGGSRRLVRQMFARSVDWAPSGQRLVIDSPFGLMTCSPTGDSLTTILSDVAFSPSWSPTADLIAYDDGTHIWAIPDTGGVPTCLTAALGGGNDPSWSPDGQSLLILAGFAGAQGEELATISLSGQLLGRITHDMNEDRAPAWAPTGATVAWNKWPRDSNGRVHPEYWVSDTSGTAPRLLIDGEGQVDWSPDGSKLVVARQTSSGTKLFTISSLGNALKQITF